MNNISKSIFLRYDYHHISGTRSLSPLLGVKFVHLLDNTDLFEISNLVQSGKEIVTILYSSLEKCFSSFVRPRPGKYFFS